MAAYAATIESPMKKAVKGYHNASVAVYAGKCTITNYNQTPVEITAITRRFHTLIAVVPTAYALTGKWVRWDHAAKVFRVYEIEFNGTDIVEAANDQAIGEFDFIAYGLA